MPLAESQAFGDAEDVRDNNHMRQGGFGNQSNFGRSSDQASDRPLKVDTQNTKEEPPSGGFDW